MPSVRLAPRAVAVALALLSAPARAAADPSGPPPGAASAAGPEAEPASAAAPAAPEGAGQVQPIAPAPSAVPAGVAPQAPPPPPAGPGAAAAPPPRRVHLVALAGYDYGFEDLLKVGYEGGGTDRIGANGGFVLAAGAAVVPRPGGALDLRATAGVKYDTVSGSNGSAYFLAFPLELTAGVTLKPLRLSAGPSLLLGPRLKGERVLAQASVDLRTSLGLVGQLELVLPLRGAGGAFTAGVRYTWQKLQASSGGNAIDASALGLLVGVVL